MIPLLTHDHGWRIVSQTIKMFLLCTLCPMRFALCYFLIEGGKV